MENSKCITKKFGNFNLTMYEVEFCGCNPIYREEYYKVKIRNKVYDTTPSKSEFLSFFKCEYGDFSLYLKKNSVGNEYFVHFETNDGKNYIFLYTGNFLDLRKELEQSDKDCMSLINKTVTEDFEDFDFIYDENKPNETTFFNVNTEEMYEAYLGGYGDLIFHRINEKEYEKNHFECDKNYESIKTCILNVVQK